MIFIIRHDRHCRAKVLTKRLNELKIKKYDMVVLSWTFNRFFCSEYYFVCAVSPLSRSLPSQLWNDDVCLGSCWTRLCNSCRDIGKSHIFTLANYSIWPKFFVKRHTALECWASALFMQRWPVFFSGKHCMKKHEKQNIPNFQIHQKLYGFSDSLSKLEPLQFKGMRF